MQDLLTELLWRNTEIDKAAADFDLYDRYFSQLIRYTGYEVQAYYALGLGLRGALARELGLHSPK